MTFGTPAILRTFGTCPPPQPSMWKAWMVRPSSTLRVSSTVRHSLRPSLCRATWTSCSSATRRAVSRARAWAPMSSWTLKPQAPPSASASTRGAGSEDEPRARKPMLTGQASKALKACFSAQGELTPTPQAGPISWPMTVVTPEARDASMIRGESRCTWVSTAPAVAISPSPETIVVPVPTTTSTPSSVSGFPARPIAWMRPCRMPTDTLRMPWTASMTRTLLITTSQVSDTAAALRCRPSRAVFPKPARNSSPGRWLSDSTRTTSPESPSLTRSPARGPCTEAYSWGSMCRPAGA
ncbi:hypothetical protein SSPNP10_16565 [Streptomyces sp. NP10]|nr:hypothetical protein SSPNP10_16565 [Streptomyces sp. NP10]